MSITDFAEQLTKFTGGSELYWTNCQLIIPKNVIIITTDTKIIKRGNGTDIYIDLPIVASIENIDSSHTDIINTLSILNDLSEDMIIIVDNEMYSASTTKLSNILSRISFIQNTDILQDNLLLAIESKLGYCDTSVSNDDNGKLAIIKDGKISVGLDPHTYLPVSDIHPIQLIHITNIRLFSDKACTIEVDGLLQDSTYYLKIDAMHDNLSNDDFSYNASSNIGSVTINQLDNTNIFKVTTTHLYESNIVTFTGYVSYTDITINRSVQLKTNRILTNLTNIFTIYSDIECTIPIIGDVLANTIYYIRILSTIDDIFVNGLVYEISTSTPNIVISTINASQGKFQLNVGNLYTSEQIIFDIITKENMSIVLYSSGYTYGDRSLLGTINKLLVYSDSDFINLATSITANGVFYVKTVTTLDDVVLSNLIYELSTAHTSVQIDIINAAEGKFKLTVDDLYVSDYLVFTIKSIDDNEYLYSNDVIYGDRVLANSISTLSIYSDQDRTLPTTSIESNNTYYASIVTTIDGIPLSGLTYTLSTSTNNISFTEVDPISSSFEITVGQLDTLGNISINISVIDDNEIILSSSNVDGVSGIRISVYGREPYDWLNTNNGEDGYNDVIISDDGYIYAVGYTKNSTGDVQFGLVTKFDMNLNVISSNSYGDPINSWIGFNKLTITADNKIICVGEESLYKRALIVIYNNDLTVNISKTYGTIDSNLTEVFNGVVIDSIGNIYCVGNKSADDFFIVKFDPNLSIIDHTIFVSSVIANNVVYDVDIDTDDNLICVGYRNSIIEGIQLPLIIKLSSNLDILSSKYITDTSIGMIDIKSVTIDDLNNIYCSSGPILIKLSSSLDILAGKVFNNISSAEHIYTVAIDSNDNVLIASTFDNNGIITKTDINLSSVISRKRCLGNPYASLHGLALNQSDNIISVGSTNNEGLYDTNDTLIIKLPQDIPEGTFAGSVLDNMILDDMILSIINVNIVMDDWSIYKSVTGCDVYQTQYSSSNEVLVLRTELF